jgi:hypothetical protein
MQQKISKVIAIKPHKYGTRHLVAGDEYEIPARHALALVAGKKARYATSKRERMPAKPVPAPPDEAPPAEPVTVRVESGSGDIEALRVQATQLGLDVDGRWGVARLRYEIERMRK